ncbi:hypothetical protein JHK87_012392 [Glycine soja]|nr:hypothetical protein JHK87_012392 [Glycine soja]
METLMFHHAHLVLEVTPKMLEVSGNLRIGRLLVRGKPCEVLCALVIWPINQIISPPLTRTLHSLALPLTLALATSSRPPKSITRFRDELDVVLDYRFLALPRLFVGGIYVGALVGLIVEGLLSPLISLLLSSASPSDCRALAATLLTSLTVLHVNKATIGAFLGSIHALVTLLRNGKGRERKEAATTLYALCSFPDNRRKAVECGAVPILLWSTDSGLEMSVEVIGVLSKSKEGRE